MAVVSPVESMLGCWGDRSKHAGQLISEAGQIAVAETANM